MQQATPNHGPALERGIWVAVIIAALVVVLRVFAKIKISRFFVDDVLMIIASVRSRCPYSLLTQNPLLISLSPDFGNCVDRFPHAFC